MTPVGVFFICQNEDKCHFVNSTKFAHTPSVGPLPEGMGKDTAHFAEERRTGRHGANGRVFTNGFELLNRFRQCCRKRFSVFSDTPSLPLPKKQRGEYPGIKSSCKRFKVKGVQ